MIFLDSHDYEMPHDFRFNNYPSFTDFVPKLFPGQFKPYRIPPELQSLTIKPSTSAPSTSSSSSATPTTLVKRQLPMDKHEMQKRDAAVANVNAHHVITSADFQHSARLACTSPGYVGPDVVSLHEQMFCDFQTKTLWPLCRQDSAGNGAASTSGEADNGCYDKDELSLVREGKLHKRSYVRSEVWEMNGDVVVEGKVVNKPLQR